MKTSERVVLISGSTGVIGSTLSRAFAKDGYKVALGYGSNKAKAEALAADLKASGGSEVLLCPMNLSDAPSLESAVDAVRDKWERIDVLINNAAVARDRQISDLTMDDWQSIIQVNLTGSFVLLRAAAAIMREQRDGHIVNMSSRLGLKGGGNSSNYSASKAGLIALSQAAAAELGKFNIRVNTVMPGFHTSPLNMAVSEMAIPKAKQDSTLGLTTAPEELAQFVIYLTRTKTISSQIFNIDSRPL